MTRRTDPRTIVRSLVLAFVAAGCSTGTPSATPMPVATSAAEFAAAWCSSLEGLARAIGNPDTAADSKLSAALDVAIERADYAGVDQVASQMKAELEAGRAFAAVAAGWPPGAAMMVHVDRLLLAAEAMVEAKRAGARQGRGAADGLGQAALEQAGGIAAWQGMFDAAKSLPAEALARMTDCRWWEAGAPGS
jgi:hypothetical protein